MVLNNSLSQISKKRQTTINRCLMHGNILIYDVDGMVIYLLLGQLREGSTTPGELHVFVFVIV